MHVRIPAPVYREQSTAHSGSGVPRGDMSSFAISMRLVAALRRVSRRVLLFYCLEGNEEGVGHLHECAVYSLPIHHWTLCHAAGLVEILQRRQPPPYVAWGWTGGVFSCARWLGIHQGGLPWEYLVARRRPAA